MEESAKDRWEKDYKEHGVECNRDKRPAHNRNAQGSRIEDIPGALDHVEGADIQAELIDNNMDEIVKNISPNETAVVTGIRLGPNTLHAVTIVNVVEKGGKTYLQVVDTLERPQAYTTTASEFRMLLSTGKAAVIRRREE